MNKKALRVLLAGLLFFTAAAYALMEYTNSGAWKDSWPKELDSLRKTSYRVEGPIVTERHYIPFSSREEFEKAWPYLLQVKPQNRLKAIRLVSPPLKSMFDELRPLHAGVMILENPGPHMGEQGAALTLVVDGEIVDLNRIPLPRDTVLVDDRFSAVGFEVSEELKVSK